MDYDGEMLSMGNLFLLEVNNRKIIATIEAKTPHALKAGWILSSRHAT